MSSADPFHSRLYFGVFVAVTVVAVGLALVLGSRDTAFAAAILGLYVLHLYSVRTLLRGQQEQWRAVRELEDLVGELARAEEASPEDPPPGGEVRPGGDAEPRRHFALGTVAIIRNVLRPEEVSRVLVAQRERPETRFGELAVEMGLLTDEELERLLRDQREGRFGKSEIRLARRRLEGYHEQKREKVEAGPEPPV